MVDSLRVRLLLWYTLILALVTALFGGAVCYRYWRAAVAKVDAELLAQAQSIARVVIPATGGTFDLDLPEEAVQYFHQDPAGPYYALWNATGALIDRSDGDVDVSLPPVAGARSMSGRREMAIRRDDGIVVLVGRDVADLRADVWALGSTIVAVGAFALALSLVGGWFLSGRAMAPIARISRTARAMSEGDLSARIAVDRTESELGQLASTLNSAFDRLGDTLERQQRFTADASHELRTPLATLSAELEWALGRGRTAAEYHRSLQTCARAAARMREVVQGLLTLARADAGELLVQQAPVPLRRIVHEVVDTMGPAAEKKSVVIALHDGAAPQNSGPEVRGDGGLLRQAIANVVSNAIQYNVDGGRVDVTVSEEPATVLVAVSDTGHGIHANDLPRIFDRFYRADEARAREAGGAGLGLALAKWIVERHGGEISCSSEIGRGARFVIRLPAPAAHT
jgi:two-component system OmpR family sensor kinase